ncbi:MAG: bifunctional transaldolase/phosoglucose isomerase [Pleurocapsa minor GSE-CHR-MK-17-07R]|jgi:transaldolase/glucose-6-phosphate isomerase|nr:bifunctional transaldolase/phosoglucose isomerase [Pleurocapsa minor GSE-CHR-MK 17-07R]
MSNPLLEVQAFGQSIWYDNIRRSLITGGELRRLIEEDGVLGVTSNPAIFQKAIGLTDEYDDSIREMLMLEPYEIYEALAVQDIRDALDLLRPVYDRTGGRDGFVSLEVSPLIAHDTATTISEAKRLFALLNRPNAMIKIPATSAGIPAIEEAIFAGVNINVTLIFGIDNYEQVAEAYIRGLERRVAAGLQVDHVDSVASFFLSRIDTLVDKTLDNNIRAAQGRDLARVALNNKLKGKAAIANARLAYQAYKEIFNGHRFARLKEAGANVQRVLWASTGTKNANYPDTMYVDSLIGRDTVNTLPPDTLAKFKDHGKAGNTLEENVAEAEQSLALLREVGIDMKSITNRLQADGVEQFIDAFEGLLNQVNARRNVLATGVMSEQEVTIGGFTRDVEAALSEIERAHTNARLWNRDGTLWKDHPVVAARIANALGWLDPFAEIDMARLHKLRESARALKHVVFIGMGGSTQPADTFQRALGSAPGFPSMHVLNTTDPDEIMRSLEGADIKDTLFVVASKSGTTFETQAIMRYFFRETGNNGGQFIAITVPGSPLDNFARLHRFRDVFPDSAHSLGSYSALGYVGWVPAALLGADLDALEASVRRMIMACSDTIAAKDHPGLTLGAIMATLGGRGKDKMTLVTSPGLNAFAVQIEHIVAESTGKEGRSLLPIVAGKLGRSADYSSDRLFIFIRLEGDDNQELDDSLAVLAGAGHPIVTLHLKDRNALAGEFFRWEFAMAIAARQMQVNPFDFPNVNETRLATDLLLEHYIEQGALPEGNPVAGKGDVTLYATESMASQLRAMCRDHRFDATSVTGLLAAQLNGTAAGDFIALMAFLPRSPEVDARLQDIRLRMRHATRRAVPMGYGPDYLHSTGQLYKGSGANGVFIMLTADKKTTLEIPEAGYDFATAQMAQALGDLQVLQRKDYRVLRLHGTTIDVLLDMVSVAVDEVMARRA